ncbi:hypothetical protein C3D80_19590 [Cronobacter sakazakii]|uniref:hypothetical protein n=1 Tax=Cronobacter sakazakii TaxID=28141 RepID=UPI0009B98AEA|nr:hypothetical protein [Cronobacter sakazakii]MDK1224564.1 hypothetical protein [Cronobacter turicensis]EJJ0671526.1 hypothetical protein [Cronobacter sakazakii]EMC4401940.1 hypothetical protein [Cronobacter sakazakii]KAB0805754.1 hypothetical protein FZI15_22145 [Cronobacter sakazakii]KAB0887822.1 hypothetical protein FZI07_20815 [Cronobacter sakazakii]
MNDQIINVVGILCLAGLVWYVNIYRPKKKLMTPGELQLKSYKSFDKDLYYAVHHVFGHPHIIKNNVVLDDLIYSPEMDKKQYFRKAMREHRIAYVVMNDKLEPLLAVDHATLDDTLKQKYLTAAGIGYCIFDDKTPVVDIIGELENASVEIKRLFQEPSLSS